MKKKRRRRYRGKLFLQARMGIGLSNVRGHAFTVTSVGVGVHCCFGSSMGIHVPRAPILGVGTKYIREF